MTSRPQPAMGGEAEAPRGGMSDAQHSLLSQQMIAAKQARAKAEAERQIRLNRIARLQAEEMKLMKRIEEAHRRTKDVLAQKAAKEQAAIERQNLELAKSDELNEQRLRLVESKMQQRVSIRVSRGHGRGCRPPCWLRAHVPLQRTLKLGAARVARRAPVPSPEFFPCHARHRTPQSSQEACWINRHHAVQSVKERKESIASEAEARRRHELRQKMELRDDIRRQDEARRERRRLAQEAMEQQLKAVHEAKLSSEEARIREQESKLQSLERRERELLQRLRSYQGEQRDALHELESCLPSGGPSRLLGRTGLLRAIDEGQPPALAALLGPSEAGASQ